MPAARREVVLADGIVCLVRKHRRARQIRITVSRDGSVRLTLPFFVPYRAGELFLKSKSAWIRERLAESLDRPMDMLSQGGEAEYRERRAEALALAEERLAVFAPRYGVRFGRVSIRNQRTRWGSCSRSGNLSFNYRIIHLPEQLRDYVIVHELCHLVRFDHSEGFWRLVAETFPEYRRLRKELRLK